MSAKNSPTSGQNRTTTDRLKDRLPELPASQMTPEQKAAVAEFSAGRGYAPLGPFNVMLRSPEVMLRAKAMGDYLRYKNRLPKDISEMVILQTARGWSQSFEFTQHAKFALQAGLPQTVIDAIADGRRPEGLNPAQSAAYEFTAELQANKRVSDATYARAVATFGEPGVIDLTGVQGYYTFLAMMMNVARTPAPADGQSLERWPEG
jgi:4-carboxymuconolactone decarboxylase